MQVVDQRLAQPDRQRRFRIDHLLPGDNPRQQLRVVRRQERRHFVGAFVALSVLVVIRVAAQHGLAAPLPGRAIPREDEADRLLLAGLQAKAHRRRGARLVEGWRQAEERAGAGSGDIARLRVETGPGAAVAPQVAAQSQLHVLVHNPQRVFLVQVIRDHDAAERTADVDVLETAMPGALLRGGPGKAESDHPRLRGLGGIAQAHLKDRPRRVGERHVAGDERRPRAHPHADRTIQAIFQVNDGVMPPIMDLLGGMGTLRTKWRSERSGQRVRVQGPRAQHPAFASLSLVVQAQSQEWQIERPTPGHVRVKDRAIAQRTVRFEINAPGINAPQRHPVPGRGILAVNQATGG